MKDLRPTNQMGMSLIEVFVGLAISSIVMVGIADQAIRTQRTVTKAQGRLELDQSHYLANQRAMNLQFVSEQLGIVDAAGKRLNAELDRCLSGRALSADNCLRFKKNSFLAFSENDGDEARGQVRNEIWLSMDCSNTPTPSCASASSRVVTKRSVSGVATTTRTSDFVLSASELAALRQIDFGCSGGEQIVTGIDLVSRQAMCTGLSFSTSCRGGGPIHGFGSILSCPSIIKASCGSGFSRIGLFGGSGECG